MILPYLQNQVSQNTNSSQAHLLIVSLCIVTYISMLLHRMLAYDFCAHVFYVYPKYCARQHHLLSY